MTSISTINVPFHGSNLFIVNYNGEPYVPMKPIVEGMGLDWMGQYRKLTQRFSKGIEEMSIPTKGGEQSMICLALRKLAGWLHTISPNKVKPEIRDKVIQYQEECDDVLYEYWTTGEVKAKQKSTVQERNPLKNAVNLLVSKKGIMYPEAYSLVHQQFNVSGIDELTADQIPMAVEYVHKLVMEGEYIPKQQLPQVGLESLAMPMSFFDDYDWLFELEGTDKDEALSSFYKYPQKMLKNMTEYPNPLGKMLTKLSDAGVNVDAAWLYLRALKHNYEVNTRKLNSSMSDSELSRLLVVRNRFDKALSLWKDNLCRNLIRMDVPSAVPFNQAITDALSELRIITDKISERLIA